jgi:hypothetical protein
MEGRGEGKEEKGEKVEERGPENKRWGEEAKRPENGETHARSLAQFPMPATIMMQMDGHDGVLMIEGKDDDNGKW